MMRYPLFGLLSLQVVGSLAWLQLLRNGAGWLLFLPWSHARVSSIPGFKEALLLVLRLLPPAMYFFSMWSGVGKLESGLETSSGILEAGYFVTMASTAWAAFMLQVGDEAALRLCGIDLGSEQFVRILCIARQGCWQPLVQLSIW
jgi:hypothetical protein